MKRNKIYALLNGVLIMALSLALCLKAGAQGLSELKTNVDNYKKQVLKERLYVHVNKDFYLTGEILWFKVYNVEGASKIPLDLSKVAYIELLDAKNSPVLQTKVSLKNGQGNGSIYLPASVANGNYLLRAYTNWMKNFDAGSYFEKPITIVNLSQQPEKEQLIANADFDVQFMPEGGKLVWGIKSKVAVKVSNSNGKGVDYSGNVLDGNNNTVTSFSSFKFGIGTFMFTPEPGKTYKAVVKIGDKTITKALPSAISNGYVMQAEDKGTAWDITVSNVAAAGSGRVYLLLHSNGAVLAAAELTLIGGLVHYVIEKNKLADGVNQLTLFNTEYRQPLCERLIFKRPAQLLKIEAITNAATYATRQVINVDLNTVDEAAKPQAAAMSVSVYRVDSLQQTDNAGINSYMWLSADVKGTIESPDYYFKDNGKETEQAIDNLLLAQGWRSFNWADATSSGKPSFKFLPEYAGHIMSGTVTDKESGRPAANVMTYAAVPGTKARLFATKSDGAGHFLVNAGEDMQGTNEVVLQTNHFVDSTSSYKIDLISPFSEQYSTTKLPSFTVPLNQTQLLKEYGLSMQVQSVYQTANMRRFYATDTDSSSFYGKPVKTFVLDEFTRFTTMEEVMREFVSYIFLSRKDKKLYIKIFNGRGVLDNEPLVMLDGVPLFDNSRIFEVDPLKVKKVDVLAELVYNGPTVFNGLMNFTTYKGDMAGFQLNPKAILLDYEGLQAQRQFYSPVYDDAASKASRLPDFRTALYWNPDLTTSTEGKGSFSYYTSDVPGKYIGVIQGINNNGRSGSSYFSFEVK